MRIALLAVFTGAILCGVATAQIDRPGDERPELPPFLESDEGPILEENREAAGEAAESTPDAQTSAAEPGRCGIGAELALPLALLMRLASRRRGARPTPCVG